MDLEAFQKRTWAEINIDNIKHNFNIVKSKLSFGKKLCCVVKANAYGHGAIKISKIYESLGADYLAVSNIEEALQIRSNNVSLPILILGYTNPECAKLLAENNITQCVYSKDYGNSLAKSAHNYGVKVKVHVKIDTGMGRIGFLVDDNDSILEIEKIYYSKEFICEGIFTHFACADGGGNGEAYTRNQYERFLELIDKLQNKGVTFEIKHCSNSAAIFDYPEMQLDMVRAGIVLYGLAPSGMVRNKVELKQVMELKSVVTHIKTIKKGVSISYGGEYIAEKEMRIATVPIGYADGFWRSNYSNNGFVFIGGKRAQIVGRICMDQCMIDVSDLPEVDIGSIVEIYSCQEEGTIDLFARMNKTINYELVCALGERVPRVYLENNKVVLIQDNVY